MEETIKTSSTLEFDKEEYLDICNKINTCINNMDAMKIIKDQQKEINATTKRLRLENKDLLVDIINFAETYNLEVLHMDNGYTLKFVSKEKKAHLNNELIKQALIDQLKLFNASSTIESIGYDTLINKIMQSIDNKCKEQESCITSVQFIKPKKNKKI